jgi:acyl-CoA thioesterase FadM
MSDLFDGTPVTFELRPSPEGANIQTWIGFKHFMYLVEEAAHAYLRHHGFGAESLFRRFGLGVEISDCGVSLPAKLGIDDQVTATVTGKALPSGGLRLNVRLEASGENGTETVLTGRVRLALVKEKHAVDPAPTPLQLKPLVAQLSSGEGAEAAHVIPSGTNALVWSTRVPYYYCHYSTRLRHSGYVRLLEEGIDRLLTERGISVRTMLDTRGWVPVVSRARIRVLGEACMEDPLYTVVSVEDVIADRAYTARMDCYTRRGDDFVHTATGTITHGYVVGRGPGFGQLVEFDPQTVNALRGVA